MFSNWLVGNKKIWIVVFFTLYFSVISFSQRAILNSSTVFYQLGSSGSICNTTTQYAYCNPNALNNLLLSSALYKDTLFFVSPQGKLYRMRIGDTGSCLELMTFPANGASPASITSLVVSKYGLVYAADEVNKNLYRYNPVSNVLINLGVLNSTPSGDLIFYKDKLIMTALDGNFYELNLSAPGSSTVYIPATAGRIYNGLIAVPNDCTSNKFYAFENVTGFGTSHAYEVDMVNRTVLPQTCDLPFIVYDGASNVDDGSTLGITIDSINIITPCGANPKGSVKIRVSTAGTGVEYTLNGTITNSTGVFTDLLPGSYLLSIKNSRGCSKDSSFIIKHGVYANYTIDKIRATNCNTSDAQVTIHATTDYLPLQFSCNNGAWTTDSIFINLTGGSQNIRIRDAGGCMLDSNIIIGYITRPNYLGNIITTPSFCTRNNGSFQLIPAAGYSASNFSIAINGASPIAGATVSNLNAGLYNVKIIYQGNCTIDTLVTIPLDKNTAPGIVLTVTPQQCLLQNGAVAITATGTHAPYLTQLDGGGYSGSMQYSSLINGNHPLQIKDADGCVTDTFFVINPYVPEVLTKSVSTINPTCREPLKGSITVSINGARSPYHYFIGTQSYANGAAASGLQEGTYTAYIYNSDNCLIDSVAGIALTLPVTPDCENIWIPTAFSPNDDGLNDVFKPITGSAISLYKLSIYNRFGELVFSTTDRTKGWDGKFNGIRQDAGVFAYSIIYNTVSDSKLIQRRGSLTLVR